MEKLKPNKIKCKCGYEWNTFSKLAMVSCPSCLKKTPNHELIKNKEDNKK